METIIEIDLLDEKDFLETYNQKQVKEALINYLINETPSFNLPKKIQIKINSKLPSYINIETYIMKGLKNKYQKNYKIHFKNMIIQLIYILIGAALIFISTLIQGEVFKEVILICGWVLIWLAVELEVISDIEDRKKRKKLKTLLASDVIINKIN